MRYPDNGWDDEIFAKLHWQCHFGSCMYDARELRRGRRFRRASQRICSRALAKHGSGADWRLAACLVG